MATMIAPFTKVVRVGSVTIDNRQAGVYVKIQWKEGANLSLTGVEGPKSNGDALGSAGQIGMPVNLTYAEGWDAATVTRLWETWKEWHLNDMQAGCEHQRTEWNVEKALTTTAYTWSSQYHEQRKKAESGELTDAEYAAYRTMNKAVHAVTMATNAPKYETADVTRLLADGWIKPEKTETRMAGWVYESEHPEGLLMKPCSTCGYKYGSEWKRKEVPEDVLAWLQALPDADQQPAWA